MIVERRTIYLSSTASIIGRSSRRPPIQSNDHCDSVSFLINLIFAQVVHKITRFSTIAVHNQAACHAIGKGAPPISFNPGTFLIFVYRCRTILSNRLMFCRTVASPRGRIAAAMSVIWYLITNSQISFSHVPFCLFDRSIRTSERVRPLQQCLVSKTSIPPSAVCNVFDRWNENIEK